ncbi:MAG: ribosome maturation factor RimM [Peptococcaceae bacterium]|nr:ribosome maturation factor RimM [Peptococcaceae bacterium]
MDKTRIGKILNAHGVRGELKIEPLTDNPDRYYLLKQVYVEDRKKKYVLYDIESVRFHKGNVLVKLAGIDDMDAAKALKNQHLAINKCDRMPLEEGAYYIDDLIGLSVFENDEQIGTLKDVLQPGANDVYVLESDIYPDLYIPAIKSVILKINLDAKRMDVKLPKGLVD